MLIQTAFFEERFERISIDNLLGNNDELPQLKFQRQEYFVKIKDIAEKLFD